MCTSWVSLMTHFVAGQANLSTCIQATCIQVTVFIGAGLLTSIGVCVHTTVHGTCHVLSVRTPKLYVQF